MLSCCRPNLRIERGVYADFDVVSHGRYDGAFRVFSSKSAFYPLERILQLTCVAPEL